MIALQPMADHGALARFADEATALRWANAVRRLAPDWLLDVVQAYTTVAVYHDPTRIRLSQALRTLATVVVGDTPDLAGRFFEVPCCYEHHLDLARIASYTGLSDDEIIRLHGSVDYSVYAIGFCPGFPFLGYLAEPLRGVPRLESPRVRVEAGSVGLTGRQTGVYTEVRPGGWNIVGRTPLVLVDSADGYFPLRTGDRVRFVRIDEAEYRRLEGERL